VNTSEAIAKYIVEALIPGVNLRYTYKQNEGEHDYDLIYEDGRMVPLEVTVSTHRTYKELMAAILDEGKGGSFVKAVRCQQDWYVFPTVQANINKIRELIDEYLEMIEAEGIDQFSIYTIYQESPAVRQIYKDLQIEHGMVVNWKKPGSIGIALPSQAAFVKSYSVFRAVEQEAEKIDNRQKLGNVNAPERHLFVYIEFENYAAWLAITESVPLQIKPKLPAEITHVWAVSSLAKNKYVVWRASNFDDWHSVGTVEINSENIMELRDRTS
jgi:hypothetical protein